MIACKRALATICLVLASCQPAEQPTAPEGSAPSEGVRAPPVPGPDAIVSAERLVGEYRVAGVDGQGIDLPYGVTASITGERIHVVADCVNLAWSYRFENGRLATERVPTEGCARGLTPSEEAIVEAFDAADHVALNRSNGYEFTGGGHSVTLFTQ